MTQVERIKNDPRVIDTSDEREYARAPRHDVENGNGYWVYLSPGFCNGNREEHIIHESSPTACLARFRDITSCNCADYCATGEVDA